MIETRPMGPEPGCSDFFSGALYSFDLMVPFTLCTVLFSNLFSTYLAYTEVFCFYCCCCCLPKLLLLKLAAHCHRTWFGFPNCRALHFTSSPHALGDHSHWLWRHRAFLKSQHPCRSPRDLVEMQVLMQEKGVARGWDCAFLEVSGSFFWSQQGQQDIWGLLLALSFPPQDTTSILTAGTRAACLYIPE